MFNCLYRSNRVGPSEPVLSAAFQDNRIGSSSVVIKDDKDKVLATFDYTKTIGQVLRENLNFDKLVERKIASRSCFIGCFGAQGKEDMKVQEVAKIIFPLVDGVIQKEPSYSPRPGSPCPPMTVYPCSSEDETRLQLVMKLCPKDKCSSKEWFKERYPYAKAAIRATHTDIMQEVSKEPSAPFIGLRRRQSSDGWKMQNKYEVAFGDGVLGVDTNDDRVGYFIANDFDSSISSNKRNPPLNSPKEPD